MRSTLNTDFLDSETRGSLEIPSEELRPPERVSSGCHHHETPLGFRHTVLFRFTVRRGLTVCRSSCPYLGPVAGLATGPDQGRRPQALSRRDTQVDRRPQGLET